MLQKIGLPKFVLDFWIKQRRVSNLLVERERERESRGQSVETEKARERERERESKTEKERRRERGSLVLNPFKKKETKHLYNS